MSKTNTPISVEATIWAMENCEITALRYEGKTYKLDVIKPNQTLITDLKKEEEPPTEE